MAQEVIKGLTQNVSGLKRVWLHIVFAWKEYKCRFIFSVIGIIAALFIPFGLIMLIDYWDSLENFTQGFFGVGAIVAVAAIVKYTCSGLRKIIEHF